jgi:flavin reductase (DIM6/NTAB) family NADH-FMN oxidoreductase RutF
MKKIDKNHLAAMGKIERLNLVNSCTGYKSANLIATKSTDGVANVAIFSSVTHLGSNPAMLGFILRPATVQRDTYKNIKDTGFFTVNHVFSDIASKAHQTSASYGVDVSEFDAVGLEIETKVGIDFPFVKGSPVQLLCRFLNEYEIAENNTIHVIAAIDAIFFEEHIESTDGWLDLGKANVLTVNGLDGYCLPKILDRFEYARPNQETKSMLK